MREGAEEEKEEGRWTTRKRRERASMSEGRRKRADRNGGYECGPLEASAPALCCCGRRGAAAAAGTARRAVVARCEICTEGEENTLNRGGGVQQ